MSIITIGKTYLETKARLEQNLDQLSTIDTLAERHCCYFCVKPIQGQMRILVEETLERKDLYYIDERCYSSRTSQTFQLSQNSQQSSEIKMMH